MEIKLPYSWIKEYLQTDLEVRDFSKTISLYGPSIEKANFNDTLNDFVLEIEATTNRVDVTSVIGMARESGAILKSKFNYTKPNKPINLDSQVPLSIKVEDYSRCARYQSIVIKNVKVGQSPDWLKNRLEACGINSINIIVDITNYVLLEYGQPMHAYDYNKLEGNQIIVRLAKEGESILLLGNTEPTKLNSDDLIIADQSSPICIAGVKGGEKSGIDFNTTTVVLEAANFNAVKTRKTARRHALQTDASSLFEKALPLEQTEPALLRALELILQNAGGEVVSSVLDIKDESINISDFKQTIAYPYNLTDKILGLTIEKTEVIDILQRLGFECSDKGENLEVKVPYFRASDVQYDYDIVEEIARIYGYHKIPSKLPETQIPVVKTASIIKNEDDVRAILAANGLTEVFTYSLVSSKHLEVANINPENTIEISNPLSTDFVYMRSEMASEMLFISKRNQGFTDKIKIFEISNIYLKVSSTDLPIEQSTLSMLISSNNYKEAFYELKGYFELILKTFGLNLSLFSYKNENLGEPYAIGKSASIIYDSTVIGKIGIASVKSVEFVGLKKQNAILEVNFQLLNQIFEKAIKSFKPISKYPFVLNDMSFLVDKSIEWNAINDIIVKNAGDYFVSCELFDVFEDSKLGLNKKNISFHLELGSPEKTLTDQEVQDILSSIKQKIVTDFGAVAR